MFLGVDDATVGGGGGSGFQYSTNVGFASSSCFTTGGQAFELADTLILGPVGGLGITQGTGLSTFYCNIETKLNLLN